MPTPSPFVPHPPREPSGEVVVPVVPAPPSDPTTLIKAESLESEEALVPLVAMRIIEINTDPDPELGLPPPAPAAGLQAGVDPGWTPAPATAELGSMVAPAATPTLPSTDIEELAEDDLSPESDRPTLQPETPQPQATPHVSTPPKPPPPPPAALASSETPEVEVEVTEDEAPLDAPAPTPPPPPAAAVAPPPPPAAAAKPAAEARPAAKSVDKKRPRPWWEEMFDDDFLRSIKPFTARQVESEVNFIDDRLGLQKGALVLDLACGNGRHAIGLAHRGYKVVGFDLSLAMMARAQEEAEAANQKINFLHGDMREMAFENMFDGVYCWGMSFGYFEEEKNFNIIQRAHRALRPGGVLLLDVANRDFIAPRQPNMVWFEGEGCICMDETNIDFITSRLKVKRTVMLEDGRTRELDVSIRLYGLHELGKLLHEAGFKVLEVSGQIATPGVFFGSESPRCIVLAERS